MEIDLTNLVSRQESHSSLVRFEDETDVNAPRLNYSVPLPGSFQGKFYMETDFLNNQLPWTDAALADESVTVVINDFTAKVAAGRIPVLPNLSDIAILPQPEPKTPNQSPVLSSLASVGITTATNSSDNDRPDNPSLASPDITQPRIRLLFLMLWQTAKPTETCTRSPSAQTTLSMLFTRISHETSILRCYICQFYMV